MTPRQIDQLIERLDSHSAKLDQVRSAIEQKGLTCVPLKIYFKKGRVKVEIALAKGKKKGDKRQSIKSREADREIARATSRSRRACSFCSSSSNIFAISTGPPLSFARATAAVIASSLTLPPRMSALVISV